MAHSGTLARVSSGGEKGSELTDPDLAFDALIPRSREDVLLRRFDDRAVAWSPIASQPIQLEPLTNAVFNLLDGEVSAGDLVADLCAVLEVAKPFARDVLRRELWLLEDAGLLTTSLATWQPDRDREVFPVPPNP